MQTLLSRLRSGVIDDGTAIGNGLATSINRLRESGSKSKVVILLTDGVNNAGQISPAMASKIAYDQGIKVYTVGVGKRGKAPYPMIDMFGNLYTELFGRWIVLALLLLAAELLLSNFILRRIP